MKEKPILFSGAMVKAILDGKKTQTRRVVKGMALDWLQPGMFVPEYVASPENYMSPYNFAGDQLWVKETFQLWKSSGSVGEEFIGDEMVEWFGRFPKTKKTLAEYHGWKLAYKADDAEFCEHWRPSIFMPRWASRISLEIVNLRIERLQDISRDDAKAESVSNIWKWSKERNAEHPEHFVRGVLNPYVANYSVLWDEINGKNAWDLNPWVWVIEFKVV